MLSDEEGEDVATVAIGVPLGDGGLVLVAVSVLLGEKEVRGETVLL